MFPTMFDQVALGRRQAIGALLALGGGMAAGAAQASAGRAGGLDYADPVDNLYAFGKVWSTYGDEPVLGAFHGIMYLRVADKRMLPVFGFVGTGLLHAKFDRATGTLIRKSRETGYFTDLRTGEVLEEWTNPLTGETVPVYHFYNDLASFRTTAAAGMPRYALGKAGDAPTLMNEGTVFPGPDGRTPMILPIQRAGDDHMMLNWDYTHEYTNPVTPEGWPSYSSGPRITPSEHFTLNFSRRELEDPDLPMARHVSGFSRVSQPWPFMKMGHTPFRDAVLFGRMFSHKGLKGYDEVPRKVLDYIVRHAPQFLEMPPGWDTIRSDRLDTWMAFAQDVPPETPGYEWRRRAIQDWDKPPTGLGARAYRG